MHSTMTMREARARYFEANGFGPDGGYADPWVDFKVGSVPFPVPNTKARMRAVPYHDLHHVLTGYATDFKGELEISAWEIGAGCKGYIAAWQLNLAGSATGAWLIPGRLWRAFVRGRGARSLYGLPYEELLDLTVDEARKRAGIDASETRKATPVDAALYAAMIAGGLAVGLASLAVFVPLMPFGLAYFSVKKAAMKKGSAKAAPARAS
jgi:hypothetical protein